MGKRIGFLATAIIVLGICASAWGQGVYEAWVRSYNGEANDNDEIRTMIIDNQGNIYVTGISLRDPGSNANYDYLTIKYSPDGDSLWVSRYNGVSNANDEPYAIIVDDSGYVYVTGGSGGDYGTIKYTSDGEYVWIRRHGNISGGEEARSIVVDSYGNVYVTGITSGIGTDMTTIKYLPNGDSIWVRKYDSNQGQSYDEANAIAVDDSGYVYVTGAIWSSFRNFGTIKYSPSGDTVWVRKYQGPTSYGDFSRSLGLDGQGNVVVTGTSVGDDFTYDFVTIKYNAVGDTTWVRRYSRGPSSQDNPYSLVVDDSGNIYVVGSTGVYPNLDWSTVKYSPEGETLWVRHYNGVADYTDTPYALALDKNQNVYVTGYTWVVGPEFTTVKYTSAGDFEWVMRYNGGGYGSIAKSVVVDTNGTVYVAGTVTGFNGYGDYAVVKYAPCQISGDANASGSLTLSDIISTVNYIFNKPGFSSCPSNSVLCWLSDLLCRGDWNGSGTVTLSDVIQGVNYIFNKPGGPWNPIPSGACCLPVP